MVKGHQRGDTRWCGALTHNVLQWRRSNQHHVVGVAVQPNVVGHHADGVNLTVNERNTVQRRDDDGGFIAGVDDGRLCKPFDVRGGAVGDRVVALLHEEGVKGAVVGCGVPRHDQPTTFVLGNVGHGRADDRVGCIVVVEFTGRHHGPHDRYVGEVLLARFIDARESDPHGNAGCLFDDGLVPFVGGVGRERCSSQGVNHRCG